MEDRVQTGKKSVTMSELQIGDWVQSGRKSVTMSELQSRRQVQIGRELLFHIGLISLDKVVEFNMSHEAF